MTIDPELENRCILDAGKLPSMNYSELVTTFEATTAKAWEIMGHYTAGNEASSTEDTAMSDKCLGAANHARGEIIRRLSKCHVDEPRIVEGSSRRH